MALKQSLHLLIKERGQISLAELEDYCHKAQYKLATAERHLRPSQSPEIEGVWKNNAIIGYRWKTAPKRPTCCIDMIHFGQHFGNCRNAPIRQAVGSLF